MIDVPHCQICDAKLEWRLCHPCNGDGYGDTETPDEEICAVCDGDGGYWKCPFHHYYALP